MSADRPPRSSNPAAFNRSLKDRIRNETTLRGRTTEQLRREFFLQRFLPWGPRATPGTQLSRRSSRLDPAIDTATTKVLKALKWLSER